MKTILILALLTHLAATTPAHEGHEHATKKGKTVTFTGEVVDVTCYMQHPESAVGAGHVKCAKSCIAKGLPIGFLASNGTLYTLIGPEHDPVNSKVVEHLGKPSTITGTLVEHHGVKAIVLTSIGAVGTKTGTPARESAFYSCSMHPDVHSDKPGKCPTCGMALISEKKK